MHETCGQAGLPLEPYPRSITNTYLPWNKIGFYHHGDSSTRRQTVSYSRDSDKWRKLEACRKRSLLLLIGILSHASKVVRSGRIFLRRLIDLSTRVTYPEYFIRLTAEARSDIKWWFQFTCHWNDCTMIPPPLREPLTLVSDASGTWGCGTYWGPAWFQLPWNKALQDSHISTKELAPIVLATAIWGNAWQGHTIRILSDNTAAVAAVNKGSSQLQETVHLLRCLMFLTAHHQCVLEAQHIPGQHNVLADALSRNNMLLFPTDAAHADQTGRHSVGQSCGQLP